MSGSPALLSSQNARLVAARRLTRRSARRETGRFLAEGAQAVRAALAAHAVAELFATAEAIERHPDLTADATHIYFNFSATDRKVYSVGKPIWGVDVKIWDEDSRALPAGSDHVGEVMVRGVNVMRGYYKNEEATRASFTADGWLRTGDLGHRDADGFFFVTGRIKELIIKGGENIAPREIDEVLLAHPAVLEAAAVGVADRHYGQEILACIVLREGLRCEPDELREFCVQHLGKFKTPKTFRFVASLPRGPSGKVQRLKLLEWAA